MGHDIHKQIMRTLKLFSIVLLASCIWTSSNSFAQFSLLDFQANGYGAFQSQDSAKVYSGQLSWNPNFSLSSSLGLRANLGATLLKDNGDNRFLSSNYQLLVNFREIVGQFGFDLGGGLQSWGSHGGTHPIMSANLVCDLSPMSFLNRVFIGASRYLLGDNATTEVRAGIGFSLL